MGQVEMVMPKMGESVMEGTILKWLKAPGDAIAQDESVLEVATDKVDTEVPAVHDGILEKILAQEGEVVQVGMPIAIIRSSGENGRKETTHDQVGLAATKTPEKALPQKQAAAVTGAIQATPATADGRFYSPLVMSIARQEKISSVELETILGSGKEGRVTKNDILAYVAQKANKPTTTLADTPQPLPKAFTSFEAENIQQTPAFSANGQDEIVEMDRMRKMIAERMLDSKRTSPHVTSFVEADLTNLVNWRNRHKNSFQQREGQALTFTPLLVDAIIKAIKDFPMINISVSGNQIIKRKAINIGMAVALPSGNLIVPVIHNADHLSLRGLALKVNDLAERARKNQLKPDELQGGTYTISNVGTFGNVMGTPIIVQPQVGIMAFGAIRKKPAVIETPQGDFIGIRQMMFLSHSYDHRVVDGALGGMFVRKVADYLEQFDVNQSI